MNKSRVRVNVNGVYVNIIADESEAYVFSVADEVDKAMKKVKSQNPGLSQAIIDILVMMNFCDQARKHKSELKNYMDKSKDNEEDLKSDDFLKNDDVLLNNKLNKAKNKIKSKK